MRAMVCVIYRSGSCALCRVVIMSILATIMSFTYATIGLGLSIAKATRA